MFSNSGSKLRCLASLVSKQWERARFDSTSDTHNLIRLNLISDRPLAGIRYEPPPCLFQIHTTDRKQVRPSVGRYVGAPRSDRSCTVTSKACPFAFYGDQDSKPCSLTQLSNPTQTACKPKSFRTSRTYLGVMSTSLHVRLLRMLTRHICSSYLRHRE